MVRKLNILFCDEEKPIFVVPMLSLISMSVNHFDWRVLLIKALWRFLTRDSEVRT